MGETIDEPTDLAAALKSPAHRPSPRAKVLWLIHSVLGSVPFLVAVGAWWWFDEERRTWSTWALVALAVITVVDMVVVPRWRYAVHRWECSPTAVFTRTGWWTQERRVAPISRVQTVDLERGPIARMLGLATVTVTTASSAGAVELEGLDLATAESVVADLTRITDQTPGDAT